MFKRKLLAQQRNIDKVSEWAANFTSCFYFIFLLGRRISRETPTLENHGSQTPNWSNFISGKNSPDEINLFMSPVPPGKRQLLNHLRQTLWLFNPGSTGVPGAFLNLSHPVPRFPHRVLIYKVEPSRLAPLSRGRFLDKTPQAASGGPVQGEAASPRRLHLLCPGAARTCYRSCPAAGPRSLRRAGLLPSTPSHTPGSFAPLLPPPRSSPPPPGRAPAASTFSSASAMVRPRSCHVKGRKPMGAEEPWEM